LRRKGSGKGGKGRKRPCYVEPAKKREWWRKKKSGRKKRREGRGENRRNSYGGKKCRFSERALEKGGRGEKNNHTRSIEPPPATLKGKGTKFPMESKEKQRFTKRLPGSEDGGPPQVARGFSPGEEKEHTKNWTKKGKKR